MSDDENVVLGLALLVGPVFWVVRLVRLQMLDRTRHRAVLTLAGTIVACAFLAQQVLSVAASPDVRDAPIYMLFYVTIGLAWLRVAEWLLPVAGLSTRDDLVERRNDAAMPVIVGALAGAMCAYLGGNVGSGPGWWVVIACAVIASGTLLVAWIVLDRLSRVNDVVTIDRDQAAGWRLGFFLAASGIILGRAVAGDWLSLPFTLVDFVRFGWPIVPFVAIAAGLERVFRPSVEQPRPSVLTAGLMPGLLYLAIAILDVVAFGQPA